MIKQVRQGLREVEIEDEAENLRLRYAIGEASWRCPIYIPKPQKPLLRVISSTKEATS